MKHLRFLLLAFILCELPFVSVAQDTSWYSDSETVFTLTTADQLVGFRSLVNTGNPFTGKTVKLGNSIALNELSNITKDNPNLVEWIPIGTENNPFKGAFDGNGYSLYGVYVNLPNMQDVGFMGYVTGSIRNLSIKKSYICGGGYVGGIVGELKGTIENCYNWATIESSTGTCCGGICGSGASATIRGCCNYGSITANNNVGGIIGYDFDGFIYNCANYGKVTSSGYTGGITGYVNIFGTGDRSFYNCYNFGTIYGTYAGGIAGRVYGYRGSRYSYDTQIKICVNYGIIEGDNTAAIVYLIKDNRQPSYDYYLDSTNTRSCGSPIRYGTSLSEAYMKSEEFLSTLNANVDVLGNYSKWKHSKDGFPILEYIDENEKEVETVESVSLPDNIEIVIGQSLRLIPKYEPVGSFMSVSWSSDDETIVKVDEKGIATAVGVGTTTIYAVTNDAEHIASSTIIVNNLGIGDTFSAKIPNSEIENITALFKVINSENRYVSIGDGTSAAIATATTGSITIPETIVGPGNLTYTVTSIGSKAFASSKISSVTIPSGITAIGDNAFNGCSSLTSVTVESTEPLAINSTCFSVKAGATLNVPKGCYGVYKTADVWKEFGNIIEPLHTNGDTFAASITAGSGTTDAVFKVIDATNKYVSVGRGVIDDSYETAIDDWTGGEVVILSTVTGYDGQTYLVKQISDGAFFGCFEITSIELPDGIITIGRDAFYQCARLTSFTIPATVATIGDGAFNGCNNITSINIPSNVKSLGTWAFAGCSKLTSVTVNRSEPLAIDDKCFTNAKNATLNVPKGAYKKYASAENWKNFKTIKEPAHSVGDTFAASVTANGSQVDATFKVTNTSGRYVSIGDGENAAINILTNGDVVIPSSVKGYDGQTYTVKNVSDVAFSGCKNMTSISLPSEVTEIGNSAFFYCEELTSISIPKSVTSIGTKAFKNCDQLTSVTVEWDTPISIDAECFSNAANATLYVPSGTKTLYKAADGWNLFTIKENYKDGDVFAELTKEGVEMTFKVISVANKTCQVGNGETTAININTTGTITIPEIINELSVIGVSKNSFAECGGLTGILIPNTVTSIGALSFEGCTSLNSIFIPKSVTSIFYSALWGCSNLSNIVVDSENTTYDSRDNSNAIIKKSTNSIIIGCKTTIIPHSVTSIGYGAFYDCINLTNITIPNSVKSIGDWAFRGTGLTSLTIPNSVESIGKKVFVLCSDMKKITIPNSVKTIGQYAFQSSGIETVTIPSSVTIIDQGLFYNCSELTEVTIPTSIETIGQMAFQGCEKLTSISIPSSVTSIGSNAFNCNNLTSVTVDWEEPISISTNCFSNAANATLYVPIGRNKYYKAATGWKDFGLIANKTESRLFADDVIVCRGGQIILPINLSNEEAIRQVHFELSLPAGISVATGQQATLTQRANSTHIITANPLSNGNYEFNIMSKSITSDKTIEGTEGCIANIYLKVWKSTAPNDYGIGLTDCELSIDGTSSALLLSDSQSKLTVSNVMLGDTNDDERISVTDISNIIDYILHKQVDNFVLHAADVNGDGRLTVTDISTIIDIILHKVVFEETQATRKEELDQQ